ncbi:MAG: hypothetical protein JKY65_25360 [Planctomycetes bacterium]|nr:hypothetical protein [Planctomycetota bacterium]
MPRLDPTGLSGAFKRTGRASALDFLVPQRPGQESPAGEAVPPRAAPAPAPTKSEAKAVQPTKAKTRKPKPKKASKPKASKPKASKPKASKAKASKPKAARKRASKPTPPGEAPEVAPDRQAAESAWGRSRAHPTRRASFKRQFGPGAPTWPRPRGVRAWALRRAERFVGRLLRIGA